MGDEPPAAGDTTTRDGGATDAPDAPLVVDRAPGDAPPAPANDAPLADAGSHRECASDRPVVELVFTSPTISLLGRSMVLACHWLYVTVTCDSLRMEAAATALTGTDSGGGGADGRQDAAAAGSGDGGSG